MPRITRIILYNSSTELGLGESEGGKWCLFEGPVIDGKPHRHIESSTNYDALRHRYADLVEKARKAL